MSVVIHAATGAALGCDVAQSWDKWEMAWVKREQIRTQMETLSEMRDKKTWAQKMKRSSRFGGFI